VTRRKLFGRLRFYVGNGVRLVTLPWKQYRVEFDEASNIFACSYGNNGWHHLRKTLEEYDANPDIDLRNTTLFAYLSRFCPTSICDLVDWPADEPRLPLFVYPWGTFKKGEIESRKRAETSRFCGPSSPQFIADEYAATIRLYEAMKGVGYRPWHFDNTFIAGTLLVRASRNQGDRRPPVAARGSGKVSSRVGPPDLQPVLRVKRKSHWRTSEKSRCVANYR
jgi:hypothetical protein